MDRHTTKIPKLVNAENFKDLKNDCPGKFKIKFDMNTIILILFIAFFVFFLLNCRSGIFKNIDLDPIPYSMIK